MSSCGNHMWCCEGAEPDEEPSGWCCDYPRLTFGLDEVTQEYISIPLSPNNSTDPIKLRNIATGIGIGVGLGVTLTLIMTICILFFFAQTPLP